MYAATTRGCSSCLEPGERLAVAEDDPPDRASGRSRRRSPSTPSPKRSTIGRLHLSSSRSRRWTISSLEITAAPCRSNALQRLLFPAPMPPVMATATGRCRRRARRLLRCGLGVLPSGGDGSAASTTAAASTSSATASASRLDLHRRLGLRLDLHAASASDSATAPPRRRAPSDPPPPRHGLRGLGLGFGGLQVLGDVTGLFDLRRHGGDERDASDRGRTSSVVLDPLQRQREPPAIGVHLDDLHRDDLTLGHDLARVLDVVLGQLRDVDEALDARAGSRRRRRR